MMFYTKQKYVGAFFVHFNVLKQIYCALVGVIKDWINKYIFFSKKKKFLTV